MNKFDLVTKQLGSIKYMKEHQAVLLNELITANDSKNILEIGFFQGKSSSYFAAILEDLGRGHLTTIDRKSAKGHEPNIFSLLETTGLSHRVTPLFAYRSYTWELQKLIADPNRPTFDFCYFDGGHTWDNTGFGVLLVDMLLEPGGLLLLDDIHWSIAQSPYFMKNTSRSAEFSDDEKEAKPVHLVWDTILPHLGYQHERIFEDQGWALARKPLT